MSREFFEQMNRLKAEQEAESEAKYIVDIFGRKTEVTEYLKRDLVMPQTGLRFDEFCKAVWQGEKIILITLPARQQSLDFIDQKLAPFFMKKKVADKIDLFGINDFYCLISPTTDAAYLNDFKAFVQDYFYKKAPKKVRKMRKIRQEFLNGLQLK